MNLLAWVRSLLARATAPRIAAAGTVTGTPPIAGPVSHVFVVDPGVELAASDQPSAIAAGLQAHMREDLAPHWGTDSGDIVRPGPSAGEAPPAKGEVKTCVHGPAPADPADAGALALHDHDEDGTPIIHAWYSLLQQYNCSLSSAVCHELDEARLDPEGDREVILPDGRTAALEIDDQVEALTYRKSATPDAPSVECSDFSLPSNFGIGGNAPPYDFLGKQPRQFEVMPGGYAQILTPQGWQQLQPDARAPGWAGAAAAPATGLAAYHAHLNRLSAEHGVPYTRRARRAHKHAAKIAKRSLWQRIVAWLRHPVG